jgi:uncharacterized membrane protein
MKRFTYGAFAFLCLGVSGYALLAYGLLPLGALLHPEMKASFLAHAHAIRLHIFASVVALALGPFQFSARLRAARPRAHRVMGRLYLGLGVLVGGMSGLYMAQFAFGGIVPRVGFSLLAIAWLYTGYRAYAAIRVGQVAAHREWMARNFALTFAAVMLRLYLPASMAFGIPFEAAYPAIAWLCWVPNLAAVEIRLRWRSILHSRSGLRRRDDEVPVPGLR